MKKVLLIGTGSIAEKHALNLIDLGYKIDIFSESGRKLSVNNNKINYINKINDFKKFNFAILANKTNKRIKYLNLLLNQKINIYCEKPISCKKFLYKKLEKKIVKNKIIFFTGYQLMQSEKIKYIKKILSKEKILSFNFDVGYDLRKWRKDTSKKNRYFLYKKKGGGAIFELIHEINVIQNLIGKITYIKTFKKKTNIKNKFEDLAISIIKSKKIIGTLHQEMISPIYYRTLKILCKKKIIILDFAKNLLKINNKKINIKDSLDKNLLKKNILFFIKLIKKNKPNLFYYKHAVNDLKIAIKMHS